MAPETEPRTCGECGGAGFIEWTQAIPAHSPNCTAVQCAPECPIPIPELVREPCHRCGGTGQEPP